MFAQTHGTPARHSEPACRPCVILSQLAKGKQIEFGSLSNGSAFCEAKTAKLGGANVPVARCAVERVKTCNELRVFTSKMR